MKEVKSLAEELREVGIDAATQTDMPENDGQQKRKRSHTERQVVHVVNECVTAADKSSAVFSQLRYFRFFIFLLICISHNLYSLYPILCDDILLTCAAEKPPL